VRGRARRAPPARPFRAWVERFSRRLLPSWPAVWPVSGGSMEPPFCAVRPVAARAAREARRVRSRADRPGDAPGAGGAASRGSPRSGRSCLGRRARTGDRGPGGSAARGSSRPCRRSVPAWAPPSAELSPRASRSPACHRRGRRARARLPTNLWIASDAYFAVIAPEAATAILTRGPHEAPAITTRLRLRAQDLLELDLVRDIAVPEPGRSRRRHAHLRHVMLRHLVPEVLAGQGFLPRWRRLWERARDRRCRRPRTDPSVRC
jgi:hypothetical protein